MIPHSARFVWPALATTLVHALAFAGLWPFIMDDALITYRYAKHVGEGLGPFWNVGGALRPVEGFSSFLHMFLLGALHALTKIDVVLLGKILGLACAIATMMSVAWYARNSRLTTAGVIVALSPFLLPPMMMASASGMETTLYILLAWSAPMACLRVLTAPTRARITTFVILLLLATLTRPEFAASAVCLLALTFWRRPEIRGQLAMAVVLFYVLPGLAVTGWRLATYGDVVPNTFYVKQRLPGLWGLGYVRRFLLICAAPYLLIAAPSLPRLWREQRDLILVVCVAVGVQCVYFTSVRPLMGWWYRFLIPQLPLVAWLAAVSVSTMPSGVVSKAGSRLRLAAAALLVVFGLAPIPIIMKDVPSRHADDNRLGEVGKRLRPLAAPDRTFSYYDIGRLPYEAEWTVLDVVGLTTSRHDLQGDCNNGTHLLLRSMTSSPPTPPIDIENPCSKIYETLVDLEFFTEPSTLSRRMRVFVRKDLQYKEEVHRALTDGWPEAHQLYPGWVAGYEAAVGTWFGR